MEVSSGGAMLAMIPLILAIIYGVLLLLGIYSLYLFIKLAIRGIAALDIYLDEKRNK